MVEYSPIQYHKQTRDPAQNKYFNEPVPSNYNFGFRWKPLKWTEIGLSYQRGNQIGVNFSMNFDIGKPIIPIFDIPYKEASEDMLNPLNERMTKALSKSGFSDIGIDIKNSDLWIEAQNDKYYYSARAVVMIFRSIEKIIPQDTEEVHIILKQNGIPMFEFITTGADIADLYADNLSIGEFFLSV